MQKVDRPNIGLCLDTFHLAGGEWADPTTVSGLIETAGSKSELDARFQASMEELSCTIPPEKIYVLQISDAYKPLTPLLPTKNQPHEYEHGLRPRERWSHDFRPYPFNGGYLPVVEVTKAILKTGTRCCFSIEVFDGGNDGTDHVKQSDFKEFADGAIESLWKLLDECADD